MAHRWDSRHGGLQRPAHVVAAVDERAGDTVEPRRVAEQPILPEEREVPPVVRDQAREAQAELRVLVAGVRPVTGGEGDVRVLPGAPLARRVLADGGIGIEQQRGVGVDQRQMPQSRGDGRGEPIPLAREDAPDIARDPLDLAAGRGGHRARARARRPARVRLRVGQARVVPQDRPRTTHRSTPRWRRSASMSAMRWAVVLSAQVGIRLTGQWPAAPGPALVEQDDAVGVGIEQAPLARRAARTGSTVEVERRLTSGIAAALPVHLVPVAHLEHPAVVRLDRWELFPHASPLRVRFLPDPGRHSSRSRGAARSNRIILKCNT